MSEPSLLKVSWSIMSDEWGDKHVLEFVDGHLAVTFGPMPPSIVKAFLIERRRMVAVLFDNIVRKLNAENSPDQNKSLAG